MNKKSSNDGKVLWRETPFQLGLAITGAIVAIFLYSLENGLVCDKANLCVSKWQYLKASTPNEMGDTLAGFAGSLAFVWIIVTVWIQASELREQRREFETMNTTMASQEFETTFFGLMSAHLEILGSIDLVSPQNGQRTVGRDCFNVFYTRLTKLYKEKLKKHSKADAWDMAYRNFWKDHQTELGHYFRFLFNVFRFLDESDSTRDHHVKLFRSQLSDQELLILFYNSVSEDGSPFQTYAEKFELFDNLPTVRLLEADHVGLVSPKCFGDNPMRTFGDMKHKINRSKG